MPKKLKSYCIAEIFVTSKRLMKRKKDSKVRFILYAAMAIMIWKSFPKRWRLSWIKKKSPGCIILTEQKLWLSQENTTRFSTVIPIGLGSPASLRRAALRAGKKKYVYW